MDIDTAMTMDRIASKFNTTERDAFELVERTVIRAPVKLPDVCGNLLSREVPSGDIAFLSALLEVMEIHACHGIDCRAAECSLTKMMTKLKDSHES